MHVLEIQNSLCQTEKPLSSLFKYLWKISHMVVSSRPSAAFIVTIIRTESCSFFFYLWIYLLYQLVLHVCACVSDKQEMRKWEERIKSGKSAVCHMKHLQKKVSTKKSPDVFICPPLYIFNFFILSNILIFTMARKHHCIKEVERREVCRNEIKAAGLVHQLQFFGTHLCFLKKNFKGNWIVVPHL